MYIVDKQRTAIIKLDSVGILEISGRQIVVRHTLGVFYLGTYANEERAQEVFKQILDEVFTPATYNIIENIEPTADIEDLIGNRGMFVSTVGREPKIEVIEPRVFYMPEE